MPCQYILLCTTYRNASLERTGYGIGATEVPDGVLFPTLQFPDLSPDAQPVQQLVRLCNELQLEPIHLQDVVEDFLASL